MVKFECLNGELDTSKYGSPMPIIGVYIAVATLVCFLSMVFDMWYGFHRRKPWLPCKLLSLNSLTLTIVSLATKIPVDLTSPMPRSVDQLSKITGTVTLCIFMGFLMPSLGTMRTSECTSNLASLSIMVITIIVNVCIQIVTGVIYAFIVEHAIILLFMLVLLLLLWSNCVTMELQKDLWKSDYRFFKVKENISEWSLENMKDHLERVYLETNGQNPQFLCCQTSNCGSVALLCSLAATILLEATLRSFFIKEITFCNGTSDYKWSMWLVVVSQLLTIIVGSFTTVYRWLNVVSQMSFDVFNSWKDLFNYKDDWYNDWVYGLELIRFQSLPYKFSSKSLMNYLWGSKQVTVGVAISLNIAVNLMGQLVVLLCLWVRNSFRHYRELSGTSSGTTDSLNWNLPLVNDMGVKEWLYKLVLDDIRRWKNLHKRDIPINLIQLLSKHFSPSQDPPSSLLNNIKNTGSTYYRDKYRIDYRVSSLTIVAWVIIATISLPCSLSDSLSQSLNDAIELISFIERKMKIRGSVDEWRLMLAKSAWYGRDMPSHWVRKEIISPLLKKINNQVGNISVGVAQEEAQKDGAITIIDELCGIESVSHFGPFMVSELHIICKSILSVTFASISQLSACFENTFQEMVLKTLADLPQAILNEYYGSPVEELEESARMAMKFYCKLELLGETVDWSWPRRDDMASQANQLLSYGTRVLTVGDNPSGSAEAIIVGTQEEGSGSTVVRAQCNIITGAQCDQGNEIVEEIEPEERV